MQSCLLSVAQLALSCDGQVDRFFLECLMHEACYCGYRNFIGISISFGKHLVDANSAGWGLPHSCAVPGVRRLSVSSALCLDALGSVNGLLKALSLHSTVIDLIVRVWPALD